MIDRELTIESIDIDTAREDGAIKFHCPPENLSVTPLEDGKFKISQINADAAVEFKISKDSMSTNIAAYAHPVGMGRPLLPDVLLESLSEHGIVARPDPEGIDQLRERLTNDADPTGIVIARGKPPTAAVDAEVRTMGDTRAPVMPGMKFAVKTESSNAVPGQNVLGTEIPAPGKETARDFDLLVDEHCSLSENKTEVIAKAYGLAKVSHGKVSVEPLISASDDKTEAIATVYGYDFMGSPIDHTRLEEAMKAMKIVAEPETEAINEALAKFDETSEPVANVIIARSKAPRDGKDGYLEMKTETGQKSGTVADDGHIDYKERGTIHSIHKNDLLGKLIPPEKGTPGLDIFGGKIPANDGSPAKVTAGENVRVSEDGRSFYAEIDGMVLAKGDTISVTEIYEINSDVDYSTGNIRIEKGSVLIKGAVRSGFKVICNGNIEVGEAIESAEVIAGGDIEVRGGIIVDHDGLVKAEGSVYAKFARNAKIRATGNVDIANDITACDIVAGKKVIAMSGKGRIQGGHIKADEGIEAKEIGSELNVTTHIGLGLDHTKNREQSAEKLQLEDTIKKIDRVIGDGDPRSILERTPREKRIAVAKLIKAKFAARARLEEIAAEHEKELIEAKKRSRAKIKVKGIIHPGTIVTIAGSTLDVEHAITNVQMYYEKSRDRVFWAPYE